MRKRDADYYLGRAAREHGLAALAPSWIAERHEETARHFERLAERCLHPPEKTPRRVPPCRTPANAHFG